MNAKFLPALVLIVAVAALVGSVGYAVANATESASGFGGMPRGAYSMMGAGGKATAWYGDGRGQVRDIAAARTEAQRFADRLGLKTAEVLQFTDNFYVQLDDKAGHPATEVLVDPRSGGVTLEYGPAMMWNTRYGMMGGSAGAGMMGGSAGAGMMGGGSAGGGMMGSGMNGSNGMMGRYGGRPTWTPQRSSTAGPVSAAAARQIADKWLASQDKALSAGEPDALPGYFTMETLRNGKVVGMLSVNVRTGALWSHWWHGRFVAMDA